MPIPGLRTVTVTEFTGKKTTGDLSNQALGTLVAATNTLILADLNVRRAPGYSRVVSLTLGSGPVIAAFDFHRSVDARQFKLYQRGTSLVATDANDTRERLLATLTSPAPLQFTASSFICYLSNGVDALRLVDNAGTLTAYPWGLTRPSFTPTLAFSPGTLTLTYGRRYVIAPVAKYTDSLGIERVHVGAPSDPSAHTGPQTARAITVAGWAVPTDPQQNYWWVFATTDSPDDTSATYYFAAELTAATLSWADTLLDKQLDDTRLAPFDNYPAPPSTILSQIQGVQVAIDKTLLRYSGGSQVVLGIPDEAWPLSNFFNVPTGSISVTAAAVSNDGTLLMVSNGDTWFSYSAYDGTTLTERDRVASPGQAGPLAGTQTPFGYVYLSPSKRLWLWDFSSAPVELSSNVAFPLLSTLGMDSITDPWPARVHWYSQGVRHFIVLAAPVSSGTWVSLWGVPAAGVTGPNSLLQTDKLPVDTWAASAMFREGGLTPFVYCGLGDGRICRFPDTFLDDTVPYPSALSHAWVAPVDGRARFFWLDISLDCSDRAALDALGGAATVVSLSATVLETPEDSPVGLATVPVPLAPVPVPTSPSALALRGSLQVPGLAAGRYLRFNLSLGSVPFDLVLQRATLTFATVYRGAP